jgi:hypothetical protein
MVRHLFGGLAALVLSCMLMNLVLLRLRDTHDGFDSSAILAFANLLLGLGIFLPHRNMKNVQSLKSTFALILWSACYCSIYSAFLVLSQLLPLSLWMTSLALAPMLAVIATGDWLHIVCVPAMAQQREVLFPTANLRSRCAELGERPEG